jgi:hypothetical protein
MRFVTTLVWLPVLCAALAAPPVLAQSRQATEAANRLVQRSGLSAQLRAFANQVAAQFTQHRGKAPEPLIIELTNAAKEAFRPEVLQQDITAGIARKMTVEEMRSVIAWLESAAGGRVTRAEEEASATMDEATLRKFIESMKDGKHSAARAGMIAEIIAASYAEDSTVRGLEVVALSTALGMDSMQPAPNRLGPERLQAKLKEMMPPEQMKQQIRQALPMMYAYTHRDTSDADLGAYSAFLSGPVGRRYSQQASEALMEALTRASLRLGQLLEGKSGKRPA